MLHRTFASLVVVVHGAVEHLEVQVGGEHLSLRCKLVL